MRKMQNDCRSLVSAKNDEAGPGAHDELGNLLTVGNRGATDKRDIK